MANLVGPIQHKRGTTAQWAASTVPLRDGELGIDTTLRRMKVGDGGTLFPDLGWASPDKATLDRIESVAEAIDGAVSTSDAVMTTVQADPSSSFSKAQRSAFVSLAAAAKNPDLLIVGNITRDANQAVTSADVVWPDGAPGTFTALTLSTAFPGAVDSYKITYGSPVTKTFTQPAITRNAAGAATTVPQIVVS